MGFDRKAYLRHVGVLMSGTVAAQAVNFASYPLLARLYSPADFGILAIFVAASAIPAAVACARFDLALPTVQKYGQGAVFWLCIVMCGLVGVLTTAAALLWWKISAIATHAAFAPLLGVVVFLTGASAAASVYLMRNDLYRSASAAVVVRAVVTVAAQIVLAFVWRDAMSLIIGFAAGVVGQAVHLGYVMRSRVSLALPRRRHMKAMFRRFSRQVAIDIPSTIVAAFSQNLTPVLLLSLFNSQIVGLFSLGNRLAILPIQIFNDALARVFFQKAAKAYRETGDFWQEMRFNLLASGLLSVAILISIWFFARPVVTFYLGKEWEPAGQMLVILAPMLALRSLASSIATTVFILGRPSWLLFHNLAAVVATMAAYAISVWLRLDVMAYLAVTSALVGAESAVFAIFLATSARLAARRSKST